MKAIYTHGQRSFPSARSGGAFAPPGRVSPTLLPAALLLVVWARVVSAQTYAVSNLGLYDPANGLGSSVVSINVRGEVAGAASTRVDGDWRISAIWVRGKWTYVPEPPGATHMTQGYINDSGLVVANAVFGQDGRPFLWWNELLYDLGTLGGSNALASGINALGHVIGDSTLGAGGAAYGFIWDGEQMTALPPLDPRVLYSTARGINDADVVVGSTQRYLGGARAVIWDAGAITQLPILPGRLFARANAINNYNQIVGFCTIDSSGQAGEEAVLWQDGQIIELGPLVPNDPGTGHMFITVALDINDYGEIVGRGETGWTSDVGVLWSGGERIHIPDLLPPGIEWRIYPVVINNAGQMGCYGRRTGDTNSRGFILTPPECRIFRRGDVNCDGVIDNFDIDPFVRALTDPDAYGAHHPACNWLCNLDINRDGVVNNFDIDPFVQLLVAQP